MNQTVTGRPAEPTGRPPNVKDVAQRAGVSWKTVSNVVNGRSNVRPATRERVETATRELDYRASLAAAAAPPRADQAIGSRTTGAHDPIFRQHGTRNHRLC